MSFVARETDETTGGTGEHRGSCIYPRERGTVLANRLLLELAQAY